MVHSYAQLQTTPQVVQQDLGLTPEEFDKQYLAWIDKKYGAEAAHFDEWRDKLKALVAAAEQKQYDTVLEQGPAVDGTVSRICRRRQRLRVDGRCRSERRETQRLKPQSSPRTNTQAARTRVAEAAGHTRRRRRTAGRSHRHARAHQLHLSGQR